jgi:hypothetical protein
MVQSYFGLTQNLPQALSFHQEFENQCRSRAAILGLEHSLMASSILIRGIFVFTIYNWPRVSFQKLKR